MRAVLEVRVLRLDWVKNQAHVLHGKNLLPQSLVQENQRLNLKVNLAINLLRNQTRNQVASLLVNRLANRSQVSLKNARTNKITKIN